MKNLLLTISFLFCTAVLIAQSQATLRGTVTDKSNETIIGGTVILFKGGVKKTAVSTDIDGNYSINTDGGTYDVEFSYVGLKTQRQENVILSSGQIVPLNVKLEESSTILGEVVKIEYRKPLIQQDRTTSGATLTSEEIKTLPTRNVSAMVAMTSGVSSNDGDGTIRIKGSRDGNTIYMVDGIRTNKEALPPAQEIDQLQVITGGVEAQYGDVTGGIITIQTKGPSAKYTGGVELEKSVDAYNNNLANVNVSGPIIKRNGATILGFRASGNFLYNQDVSPSAVDLVRVNAAKTKELEENPLVRSGATFLSAGEQLRDSDMEFLKVKPNEQDRRYDINTKLDARLTKNIDVTLSGQYSSLKNRFANEPSGDNDIGVRSWRFLNSERNPFEYNDRYRANFRFRHRLGSNEGVTDGKKALIQNASYSLQFGIENNKNKREDLIHQDRYMDYGYIGEFRDSSVAVIQSVSVANGPDSLFHSGYNTEFKGYKAGTLNPVLANYNKLVADQGTLSAFINQNGFQNTTYRNVWSFRNAGQIYNSFNKRDDDLINVNVNSSFDLVPGGNSKNRHSIQFGLTYEQRTNRFYSLSPFDLWNLGNQLADQNFNGVQDGGKLENGASKPLKIIGKQIEKQPVQGGGTIDVEVPIYANYSIPNADGKFYKEARKAANGGKGIDTLTHLNVNAFRPDELNLSMFSARELSQRNLINYYGFDYLGNKLANTVTFDDFFTQRDASGIRTFPVVAQRPLYTAAFIQDKFTIENIIFRVGLRIDRFDANTKVLKDPYSLYDIKSAGDFYANNKGAQPGTVGDDYKVYVADATAQNPSIKAFRSGEQWYDAKGTTVNDPNLIFNGAAPDPLYSNAEVKQNKDWIKSASFDPKSTFADYIPQVNFMPRLAFSFPISDEANFFANYDVLVSRPTTNFNATALDYFYFADAGRITEEDPIDNPNLKPEKTVYYEVGFQQKLTNSSALKLTAYYKELRDQVQRRTYLYVPIVSNYYTYGNIDFGTVKGFTFGYDLRRTNNVQMNLSYTLQFADGTGSDANTQKNLTGRGNLRSLYPLSFDERHNIQASIDYRFPSGNAYNGPKIGNLKLLENFGVNIIASAVSGTPYTAKLLVGKFGGSGTVGQINGARLPWKSNFDLKVDKNFSLGSETKSLDFNVFLRVQNVLNTRNVKGVFSASGSPENDGYLQSQIGQQEIESITTQGRNTDSFLDAYHWALLNGGNFTLPRRIFAGLSFYF